MMKNISFYIVKLTQTHILLIVLAITNLISC